jgi:hypothetical protein
MMARVHHSRLALALAGALLTACQSDRALAPSDALPARLTLTASATVPLASFGDSTVIQPRLVDANGSLLSNVPLRWTLRSAGVLESLGNGQYRAARNGQATIVVQLDPSNTGAKPAGYFANLLTDSVTITVQQQPARIVPLVNDTVFTLLGSTRTLRFQVTDARGNRMTDGWSAQWQSANTGIASVDSTGTVRVAANGTAQLSVRVGVATWSTTVSVNATRPHVSCMRYRQRRAAREQCVTNTVTLFAAPERAP